MASTMTIDAWLEKSLRDAESRDLPALKPLLEALARSMSALRAADWNDDVAANVHDAPATDAR